MDTTALSQASEEDTDWKPLVISASARIRALCKKEKEGELAKPLLEAEKRLELGLFRLVVMGEIKKGKSSFINALLGENEIVPTASDVATSSVFKILYGAEKRYQVFFRADVDSGNRPDPIEIAPDQIADYGTENGNPDNRKNVDFIGVEIPSPLLKTGLVIVDTPGIGGLLRRHRDITWQYAPRADAICFALDSVATVLSSQEIEFLKELTSKITKRIFFVQTKTDTVDETHWRSWEERNRGILKDKLGIPEDKLRYFCVSSRLKHEADESRDGFDLKESGFLPLLDFLHRGLLRSKERELAKDLGRAVAGTGGQLAAAAADRRRIFSAESQEKLSEIQQEMATAKEELNSWRRTRLTAQLRSFGDRLADLRRKGETRLQEEIDPNGIYAAGVIENLRSSEADSRVFNESAGLILQECVSDLSKIVMDVQAEFNLGFERLVSETLAALMEGLTEDVPALSNQVATKPVRGLEMDIDPSHGLNVELGGAMSSLQPAAMGGSIGATMASTGFVLLSTVFPPALAVAPFAAIIGGAIGGKMMVDDHGKRQRSMILDRLRSELGDVILQAQRRAVSQFRENADAVERKSRDIIDAAISRVEQHLESRLKELGQARKMTADETKAQAKRANEVLKQVEHIQAQLRPLLSRPTAAGNALAGS